MLLQKITEEELQFMDDWFDPVCMAETLFHDFDNMTNFDPEKLGSIRNYQLPMLSYEATIDNQPGLAEKENFQCRKNVGDIYNLGARKFGKSLVTLKLDIPLSMLYDDGWWTACTSTDAIHLGGILNIVKEAIEFHPVLKLWRKTTSAHPHFRFTANNGWHLDGINMNLDSRRPGHQFYAKHVKKLWTEEGSFESEEVAKKRKEALSELGAVIRCIASGSLILMSDMTTKLIEEVEIGDMILGWDDKTKSLKESRVLAVKNNGKKDVIKIQSEKNSLFLTPDHRILVNSKGEPAWRWIDAINVYMNKYKVKQFPYINNLQDYYKGVLIGLIDSDGSTYTHKRKSFTIREYRLFQSNEVEFFRFLLNVLGITFSEDILSVDKRGFFGKKEPHVFRIKLKHSFTIDKIYKELEDSIDIQYGYIAGFVIGDGWIGKGGSLELTQCAKNEYKINRLEHVALLAKVPYAKRINSKDAKKFFLRFYKYGFPFLSFQVKKCLTYRERFLDTHRAYYPCSDVSLKGFKENVDVYDLETTTGSFIANGFIVHNCSGMTNFTRFSPTGRAFFASENRSKVMNLPQFINPYWDEKEKQDRIEEYGGEDSLNFRIFVKGEVIEDGVSEFDMDRIEPCFNRDKDIKKFEIKKERYPYFKEFIVVERPKNADRIFINADIGESAGTDITVMSEVGDVYHYLYNITLYNLIRKEQLAILKFLIDATDANIIALDTGDAMGRNLADDLEEAYSKESIVRYAGNTKIEVGFETDKEGMVVFKNGNPEFRYEFMSEWSIARLKFLLYEGKCLMPYDPKLEHQLNSVISVTPKSGTRKVYACASDTGDHLISAWRVFAIAQWLKKDFNQTKPMAMDWGLGADSWGKGAR